MIQPTEADVGRVVVYSHPALKHTDRGVLVALQDECWVRVQFEFDEVGSALRVSTSGLDWADGGQVAR
jgi:hypothetical protein